jgi:hypothetical protein
MPKNDHKQTKQKLSLGPRGRVDGLETSIDCNGTIDASVGHQKLRNKTSHTNQLKRTGNENALNTIETGTESRRPLFKIVSSAQLIVLQRIAPLKEGEQENHLGCMTMHSKREG